MDSPVVRDPAKPFRVNSKNLFLTYPQCPIEKQELLDWLVELEGDHGVSWMVVAKENHKAGGTHLHVQIEYGRRRSIRDARSRFDATDENGAVYHPNIQGTRRMGDVAAYVTKDGDYCLHGISEEEFQKVCSGQKKSNPYSEVLESATYEDAVRAVKAVDPKGWINNGDRIRENLRFEYKVQNTEYQPIFDSPGPCIPTEAMHEWLDVEFIKKSRAKCLFLIGPSKLGKTHWARSIVEPHVYWKGMTNLSTWQDGTYVYPF